MLLYMDGASHYSTAEIPKKWTTVDEADCVFTQEAAGRADGCLKREAVGGSIYAGYLGFAPLMMQTASWTPTFSGTYGCALKTESLALLTIAPVGGLQILDNVFFSVWAGAQTHFAVRINQDGTLSLLRQLQGAPGGYLILANSLQGFTDGIYGYLEIRWTLSTNASTADGSCEIRLNETTILTWAGVLFCSPFAGFPDPPREWTSIRVLGQASAVGGVQRMCDVYLADQTSPNGDFLGDIRVAYIRPDGVGASSGWTPLSPPNWSEVNEVPPDDETSYIEATAVGTRDTYEFENVLGDPVAIQVCNYVRKTDVAGAGLKVVTRQGGVDYEGPEIGIGSELYSYRLQPYDTQPATGTGWTQAAMDATQWGPLKAS
jgi:hypothetical protein